MRPAPSRPLLPVASVRSQPARVASAVAIAALLWGAGVAGALDGQSLRLLLLGAQDMSTPQTMLRADATVTVETPKGTRTTEAIALFAPGKEARWYLQVREPALAALVLGSERKVMERSGRTTQTLAIGAPAGDLGFAYEDLSRFVADDFTGWQITDESPTTVLAGAPPAVESAYVYRAYTLDKERTLAVKVQYYARTLNNLVKLRTDAAHVLLGRKWLPGTVRIENFAEGSTTTLALRWTQNASAPPELLTPAGFAAAPALPWVSSPAAGAAPATPALSPIATDRPR